MSVTRCYGEVGSIVGGGKPGATAAACLQLANVIPLRHRNLRRLHDCPKSIAQSLTINFRSVINQHGKIGTPLDVLGTSWAGRRGTSSCMEVENSKWFVMLAFKVKHLFNTP